MSLKGQKTTTTSMDWENFKSLIAKLERDKEFKFCLLISIGVFTGLRISDILKLKFSNFPDDNEILTLMNKRHKNNAE
jgi:integrase